MERRAAIDVDALMKKSLNDISAADFIRLLGKRELAGISVILADKKKLELWVDEGPIFETPIEAVLDKIKGEKKKLELELPYDSPILDPGPLRQINYSRLVQDVAAIVEKQILEKQAIR
jgi:hypothetical protein